MVYIYKIDDVIEEANPFKCFRLTTDAVVRKLNSRYRGKHKSTDILSFPLHEQKGAPGTLPEVMVVVVFSQILTFYLNHLGVGIYSPFSKVLIAEEMELGEMVISMPYVSSAFVVYDANMFL